MPEIPYVIYIHDTRAVSQVCFRTSSRVFKAFKFAKNLHFRVTKLFSFSLYVVIIPVSAHFRGLLAKSYNVHVNR